jgi:hypothetical protein
LAAVVVTDGAVAEEEAETLTPPDETSIGETLLTPTYGRMPPVAFTEALNVHVYDSGSDELTTLR